MPVCDNKTISPNTIINNKLRTIKVLNLSWDIKKIPQIKRIVTCCICEFEFELWNTVCRFDYNYLKVGAIEEDEFLIVSLEKLLFLKAIAMKIPKYLNDLELVVDKILKIAYGKE